MFKPVLAKRQQMVQDIQSILRFWAIHMNKVGHGGFWVEPIFNTVTAYSKNNACFKRWSKTTQK